MHHVHCPKEIVAIILVMRYDGRAPCINIDLLNTSQCISYVL